MADCRDRILSIAAALAGGAIGIAVGRRPVAGRAKMVLDGSIPGGGLVVRRGSSCQNRKLIRALALWLLLREANSPEYPTWKVRLWVTAAERPMSATKALFSPAMPATV